jgi:hypothetical protein
MLVSDGKAAGAALVETHAGAGGNAVEHNARPRVCGARETEARALARDAGCDDGIEIVSGPRANDWRIAAEQQPADET